MITFNTTRLENKLARIEGKIEKDQKKIFLTPLNPILRKIRSKVKRDQGNSHVASGSLLDSIEAKITKATSEDIEIQLGYFINYGLDLELGSGPKDVDYIQLRRWAERKGLTNPSQAAGRVRNKIREEGQEAYPIILPIWENNKDTYAEEVLKRFAKVFK